MIDARMFRARSLSASGMPGIHRFGHPSLALPEWNTVQVESPTDPAFSSEPVLTATEGTEYLYSAVATAGEIAVQTAPIWLSVSIAGSVAALTGTPLAGDVGSHLVSLIAVSGQLSVVQSFTVVVSAAIDIPLI